MSGNNRKYLKFCEVCKTDVEHKVWYPYLKGGFVCGGCIKEYVKGLNECVNNSREVIKELKASQSNKPKIAIALENGMEQAYEIEELEKRLKRLEWDNYHMRKFLNKSEIEWDIPEYEEV